MPTQFEPSAVSKIIREARSTLQMDMREFATSLGVSQNSINQWENETVEPSNPRIAEWSFSETPWVRRMGLEIFAAKYPAIIKGVLTPDMNKAVPA